MIFESSEQAAQELGELIKGKTEEEIAAIIESWVEENLEAAVIPQADIFKELPKLLKLSPAITSVFNKALAATLESQIEEITFAYLKYSSGDKRDPKTINYYGQLLGKNKEQKETKKEAKAEIKVGAASKSVKVEVKSVEIQKGEKKAFSDPIEQILSGWKTSYDEKKKVEFTEITDEDYKDYARAMYVISSPVLVVDKLIKIKEKISNEEEKKIFLSNAKIFICELIKAEPQYSEAELFEKLLLLAAPGENDPEEIMILAQELNDALALTNKEVALKSAVDPNEVFESEKKAAESLEDYLNKELASAEPLKFHDEGLSNQAEHFAKALKRYDSAVLIKIKPAELQNQAWMKSADKAPNAISLMKEHSMLASMVRDDILLSRTKEHALNIFKFYVKALEKCMDMKDYHAATAICAALQNPNISRLKFLQQDEQFITSLQENTEKLSANKNYKVLKGILDDDLQSQRSPILYLGCTTNALVTSDEIPLMVNDAQFYNFSKLKILGKELRKVQQCQESAYILLQETKNENPAFDIGSRTRVQRLDDKTVYDRSKALEKQTSGKVLESLTEIIIASLKAQTQAALKEAANVELEINKLRNVLDNPGELSAKEWEGIVRSQVASVRDSHSQAIKRADEIGVGAEKASEHLQNAKDDPSLNELMNELDKVKEAEATARKAADNAGVAIQNQLDLIEIELQSRAKLARKYADDKSKLIDPTTKELKKLNKAIKENDARIFNIGQQKTILRSVLTKAKSKFEPPTRENVQSIKKPEHIETTVSAPPAPPPLPPKREVTLLSKYTLKVEDRDNFNAEAFKVQFEKYMDELNSSIHEDTEPSIREKHLIRGMRLYLKEFAKANYEGYDPTAEDFLSHPIEIAYAAYNKLEDFTAQYDNIISMEALEDFYANQYLAALEEGLSIKLDEKVEGKPEVQVAPEQVKESSQPPIVTSAAAPETSSKPVVQSTAQPVQSVKLTEPPAQPVGFLRGLWNGFVGLVKSGTNFVKRILFGSEASEVVSNETKSKMPSRKRKQEKVKADAAPSEGTKRSPTVRFADTTRFDKKESSAPKEVKFSPSQENIIQIAADIADCFNVNGVNFIEKGLIKPSGEYKETEKPSSYKISTIFQESLNLLKDERRQQSIHASTEFEKNPKKFEEIVGEQNVPILLKVRDIYDLLSCIKHRRNDIERYSNDSDLPDADKETVINELKSQIVEFNKTLIKAVKELGTLAKNHVPDNNANKGNWIKQINELADTLEKEIDESAAVKKRRFPKREGPLK